MVSTPSARIEMTGAAQDVAELTTPSGQTPAASVPFSLLASPGGRGRLYPDGDALVAENGRRYVVEHGIVRMLEDVDGGLQAELEAQKAAMDIYLDERLLLMRHEHSVARLAVEDLLGQVSGEVLDAGCGVGLLGRLYPRLNLYGVDASFPLLMQAGTGYRLRVECSAEQLPFEDQSLDAVLALNMLHHVIRPERALAEFARVLKRGGILVAVDPRRVAAVELAKRALRRSDPAFAESHKSFGVEEYEALLHSGGAFAVEEFRRVGLVALCGAGGLDQLGISRWLPAPGAVLGAFSIVDDLLGMLPGMRGAGLNLVVRARRT